MSKSCWVCAISRPGVWTSRTGQTGCVTSFSPSRHSCTWTVYISTGQNGARLIKMAGEEIGLQPRSKVILSQCSTEFWHDIFRSFSSLHFSCARKNLSCQGNVSPISEAWLTLLEDFWPDKNRVFINYYLLLLFSTVWQTFSSLRPDFLYSLVYDNFFQRSNFRGRNKNKNKMSQNKDKTWSNDKLSLQKCIL